MYMIWHKKLGIIKLYQFKIQAFIYLWLRNNNDFILEEI